MVCCYAVRDGDSAYLIDTGFVGGLNVIEKALEQEGWCELTLKGILLTHGHLDHTLNAEAIASRHDAWVMAPGADRSLLEGDFSGEGLGRVGGVMQQAGAALLNYRKPDEIIWYQKETRFDFPAGIEIVPLPGHTAGHSGFLLGRHLFCGDAFASFADFPHLPPQIFNNDTEQAKVSLGVIAGMDIDGVFPHHCDKASPEVHLERLRRMAASIK